MKKILKILSASVIILVIFSSCMTTQEFSDFGTTFVDAVDIVAGEDSEIATITGAVVDTSIAIAKATETFEPEQEYYIGRSVAANILTKYNVYDNAIARKYLNSICQTIVINSNRPEIYKGYFVQILDSDEINAFATSGGHILITKGMLRCADSEDSLAAVIAHEIAHIQLAHGIQAIQASRTTGAWVTGISSAASITATAMGKHEYTELVDSFGSGIDDLTQTLVNTGYSKSQEYEADAMALALMKTSGYNPYSMLDMLHLLDENCKDQHAGFVNTHPDPKYRIEEVEDSLDDYEEIKVANMRTARFFNMQSYLQ